MVPVELIVLREDGNVYDALFLVARTALGDARMPVMWGVSGSEFELVDEGRAGRGMAGVCDAERAPSGTSCLDGTGCSEGPTATRVVVVASEGWCSVRVLGHGARDGAAWSSESSSTDVEPSR